MSNDTQRSPYSCSFEAERDIQQKIEYEEVSQLDTMFLNRNILDRNAPHICSRSGESSYLFVPSVQSHPLDTTSINIEFASSADRSHNFQECMNRTRSKFSPAASGHAAPHDMAERPRGGSGEGADGSAARPLAPCMPGTEAACTPAEPPELAWVSSSTR